VWLIVVDFDPVNLLLLTGLVLAVPLLLVIVILAGVVAWLRHQKQQVINRWEQEGRVFLNRPVGINFSGQESRGMAQIRGNGFMALTDQDLRIMRAGPPAEWRISHHQIKEVTLEPAFLGKRRGMRVLVVTFEQAGQRDRLGVYVRAAAAWKEDIARAAGLDSKPN
jgi:hypothetical protein